MNKVSARLLVVFGLALAIGCVGPARIPEPVTEPDLGAKPGPVRPAAVAPDRPKASGERDLQVFLTGYSFWDNTPPASAAIARPVIHSQAGGTGTYADPVTIAVGHAIVDGAQSLDYPEGTRFYLPRLRKYGIVEDVCGDGDTPQLGPCHTGHKGFPWLDIYIGGQAETPAQAETCARRITAIQRVLIHPHDHYPVRPGEILGTTCGPSEQSAALP